MRYSTIRDRMARTAGITSVARDALVRVPSVPSISRISTKIRRSSSAVKVKKSIQPGVLRGSIARCIIDHCREKVCTKSDKQSNQSRTNRSLRACLLSLACGGGAGLGARSQDSRFRVSSIIFAGIQCVPIAVFRKPSYAAFSSIDS